MNPLINAVWRIIVQIRSFTILLLALIVLLRDQSPSLSETCASLISMNFSELTYSFISSVFSNVLEKDLSVDPISLARVHRGSYYLASRKLKGRWNCLRIMMNEKRKVKMMKRSQKSERTLNSCMHGDDHGME